MKSVLIWSPVVFICSAVAVFFCFREILELSDSYLNINPTDMSNYRQTEIDILAGIMLAGLVSFVGSGIAFMIALATVLGEMGKTPD